MARRKPARAAKPASRSRRASARKRTAASGPRTTSRKAAASPAKRRPAPASKKSASSRRSAKPAKPKPRKVVRQVARKAVKPAKRASKPVARATPAVRRAAKPQPPVKPAQPAKTARAITPSKPASTKAVLRRPVRKSPALDRERRTWAEDVVPGPPSSLDLDRTASSARSGRREMLEKYEQHTETGPALTGGDVDADWESAYSVGDEAPGGDNPTPDQDLVDDIGRAVGIEYEDNEELKGEDKVTDRDKHRWELDPASSEDFDDR